MASKEVQVPYKIRKDSEAATVTTGQAHTVPS